MRVNGSIDLEGAHGTHCKGVGFGVRQEAARSPRFQMNDGVL